MPETADVPIKDGMTVVLVSDELYSLRVEFEERYKRKLKLFSDTFQVRQYHNPDRVFLIKDGYLFYFSVWKYKVRAVVDTRKIKLEDYA